MSRQTPDVDVLTVQLSALLTEMDAAIYTRFSEPPLRESPLTEPAASQSPAAEPPLTQSPFRKSAFRERPTDDVKTVRLETPEHRNRFLKTVAAALERLVESLGRVRRPMARRSRLPRHRLRRR